MDASLRALNRFGLGARPGEVREGGRGGVRSGAQGDTEGLESDPRGWLEGQLEGDPPETAPDLATLKELGDLIQDHRRAVANRDVQGSGVLQRIGRTASREATAALTARVSSERPFVERLVAFWSNHLCVSGVPKIPVRVLAGAYEREAIRPHVLGRFEDLVLASARHPAMLLYLDNVQSVGPSSAAGRGSQRTARGSQGLNENHARELLELHTVGVDAGYSQDDVTELARILTGWTVAGIGPRGGPPDPSWSAELDFAFASFLHEPGDKRVMGVRYEESGEDEGIRVIRDLCRRPEAAAFVAGKLVRHFVADDPPAPAVARVAGVFQETGGDLREVARALVHLDEAWDPEHRKLRTPQDWLVAAVRGLGGQAVGPTLPPLLAQLRHPLWAPPGPNGFGDTVREWADPGSLMNRAELARTLAGRVMPAQRGGRRVAPDLLASLVELPPGDPLPGLLADDSIDVDERVALVLAGPAFQWR